MQQNYLADIATWPQSREFRGIPSICSAHPLVIEAALRRALDQNSHLLIEATCNQVNQDGGYTGLTPAAFRAAVEKLAADVEFPAERLIFGGDHLGPNPWKHLSADLAMDKACSMIEAYAKAGFTKLHLDTSMGCAGEPVAQSDAVTAERAARLAVVAEQVFRAAGGLLPVYIVGTEVPIPGGAMEELGELEVTRPAAAIETAAVHRRAFEAAGIADAFQRVIAAVVQPGVEFGNHNVIAYEPERATLLSTALSAMPGIVFEAHSTDYQTPEALRQLVIDGFAILKVGPGLTFALREAYYGLDQIASFLHPGARGRTLREAFEQVLTADPQHWEKYYHGTDAEQHIQRHFSYSDRIRYYWPHPEINEAVESLLAILGEADIPETLVSQYVQKAYDGVRAGSVKPRAKDLLLAAVDQVLRDYFTACRA